MYATKQAMQIKALGMDAAIFHRELRAFRKGFAEFIESAEKRGVAYINSDATVSGETDRHSPIVVFDLEGHRARREFDMVVLCPTLTPSKDAAQLAKVLGIGINNSGFFKSSNPILEPNDTDVEGIYVAGFCQEPKDILESIAHGSAVAARASEVHA